MTRQVLKSLLRLPTISSSKISCKLFLQDGALHRKLPKLRIYFENLEQKPCLRGKADKFQIYMSAAR